MADPAESSITDPTSPPEVTRHPMYVELTEGRVIRLVEVLAGKPKDPIITRLSIHELEHAPEYDAISYVWGDPTIRVPLICNGKTLDITVNLDAALRRIRFEDRSRIVWADAICINQGSKPERNHHVAFMYAVYRHAKQVLVCMGNDDGGAGNVAALVEEHDKRRKGYDSVKDMPVLGDDDPILEDVRWKSLGKLMKCNWFERAWVLQEVGVAVDPRVLYGSSLEFNYRHLMQLARWIVRCASQLEPRAGISLLTIHTDWEDWSQKKNFTYDYTLIDFLSHAKGLHCREKHDHIYAFLGHPLAQNKDTGEPILKPDYDAPVMKVYQELTTWILSELGLKVLSAVEHDEQTVNEDIPSWVARWNMDLIQNSMGYYSGFYYCASGPEESAQTLAFDRDQLKVQGISVDVVQSVYQFSSGGEWEVSEALTGLKAATTLNTVLDRIWTDINREETPCRYQPDQRIDAFSLTLCAGLTNYECAEKAIDQHRANLGAFWRLRHEVLSSGILPTEFQRTTDEGNADSFWYDLSLSCKGRTFFITQMGYFGLGPWILKPGDQCLVLRSARVPFALRKIGEDVYKVLGEAYVHSIMNGEIVGGQARDVTWADVLLA